jgi:hypothetical protein
MTENIVPTRIVFRSLQTVANPARSNLIVQFPHYNIQNTLFSTIIYKTLKETGKCGPFTGRAAVGTNHP